MASDFSVSGLISGLDTQGIIDKMMTLERQPIVQMQQQQQTLQDQSNALKDVNTRLSSLLSTISSLTFMSTLNTKTTSTDTPSTSPAIVSATASTAATNGSFKVQVVQLATATSVGSTGNVGETWVDENSSLVDAGFATTPTGGTFTINGKTITISGSEKIGDVVNMINNSGANVTASALRDGSGNVVRLSLSSSSTIRLGSAADTSNFLSAAKLLTVPAGTTIESSADMGGAQFNAPLENARLVTPISGAGSFKINGVEINYDPKVDSLAAVINRINASTANVKAAYDATSGTVSLTSKVTGSLQISLEDVGSGNFLAATGLMGAAQSYGNNAEYRINDGDLQTSTTNTVSNAVTGVKLQFLSQTPGTDVTVTVSQDTSSAVDAVHKFIDQYNSTIEFIRDKTSYNADTKQAGILLGDSTVMGIETSLRTLLTSPADGVTGQYKTLADIGITSGAIGSSVGNTTDLVLDEGKLTTALTNNPDAVASLLASLSYSASLEAGGTGSIASVAGSPSAADAGKYKIVSDGSGRLTATFISANGMQQSSVSGTITAGGTNSSLIPGVTLTAKGVLTAGTDYIDVNVQSKGVAVKVNDYLNGLTSSAGVFVSRQSQAQKQIDDMSKQISAMEDQLTEKENVLIQKFTALETAMATYQQQAAAIGATLSGLSGSNALSGSSSTSSASSAG